MDWLISQLFISIVAGLLTLALWLKRKNSDENSSENNPKRNDKSNETENKNEIATLEQRAQQHLAIDVPCYEEMKNKYDYTGFMHCYLQQSKNEQAMSTTADYNVMLELAFIDKFNRLIA